MAGKFVATFCTLPSKIFNWGVQLNSSREYVSNSEYELKVFAILMFCGKISPFSFKANFEWPKQWLLEKCGLQLFQKGFESRKWFKLSKCYCLDWLFNLTTYSRVLNTRDGLNNWGGGDLFWKLTIKGVLFNKGEGNSYETIPFIPTHTFQTIFLEHLSLPMCTSLFQHD